jgi:hypothetical protein
MTGPQSNHAGEFCLCKGLKELLHSLIATMIDWKRVVSFIRMNGNPLDNLRLRCELGEPYTQTEAEEILASYQFPDGAWDYNPPEEAPYRIGSLGGTIHCLRWLREFVLGNTQQMKLTLRFLSSIQASDGSFYETEAKLGHSPQEWLQKESIIDRFYFTAAVPMRLCSLGYGNHPLIEPALQWLEFRWNNWDYHRENMLFRNLTLHDDY